GFGPDNNPSLPGGGRFSTVPVTSLTFGAPITISSGVTLNKRGAGTVAFAAIDGSSGGLNINGGPGTPGGSVNIATFGVASSAKVTVSAGGSNVVRAQSANIAGTVDLTNNAMIVDYTGSSPLAAIQAAIASGYAGGAWNGPGINSSTAASTPNTALGFA